MVGQNNLFNPAPSCPIPAIWFRHNRLRNWLNYLNAINTFGRGTLFPFNTSLLWQAIINGSAFWLVGFAGAETHVWELPFDELIHILNPKHVNHLAERG